MNSVPPLSVVTGPERLRFGDWELDRRSGELRRGERVVRLQEQPRKVLELLVLRAGDVVTRDELIAHVWAPGVVIDFDTGLNTAIRKLRAVLEDEPDSPRFIETLPRRGYRLLPQQASVAAVAPVVTPPAPVDRPPRRLPGPLLVAAALGVALLAGLGILAYGTRPASVPPITADADTRATIAVLPFRRLGDDPADDTLATGLAESVLHQLSTSPELRVIARTSSFVFTDATRDSAEIGRSLNARYLLEGTLQSVDGKLRLTTQLVDAPARRTLWSFRFDRRVSDVFALQDEIAGQVSKILRVSLSRSGAHAAEGQGTADVDAYLDYLQGRNLRASRRVVDLREAEQRLVAATARDPQFAAAFAELATTRHLLLTYDPPIRKEDKTRRFDAALASAQRALELAPESPASLVAVGQSQKDPETTLGYLRRAISGNPNYARAWSALAEIEVVLGKPDADAMATIDTALKLDPLEPRLHYLKGLYQMMTAGDLADAEARFRQALAIDPTYYVALARLSQMMSCCLGRQAEAVRYAEQALRLDPQALWVRRLLVGLYLDIDDVAAAEQVAGEGPADSGAQLLIDLRRGRIAVALRRLDPAIGEPPMRLETGEGLFLARLPLLDAKRTSAIDRASREADERVAELGELERDSAEEAFAMVDRGAFLLTIGKRAEGGADLERALAVIATRGGGGRLPHRFAESRAVALSLQGEREGALDVLEATTASGPWSFWWYYAELEPAFAPLRSDVRFTNWVGRMKAHALAERSRLNGLRLAGLVPDRGRARG